MVLVTLFGIITVCDLFTFHFMTVRRLENNTFLGEQIAAKAMPRIKYLQIELSTKESK